MPTVPRVGRSRPPNSCSSVVLPDPEAPTMAIRSAARTLIFAPRSTCSVTPPWTNSLARSTPSSTVPVEPSSTVSVELDMVLSSIISQRFSRQQSRRPHRRIDGGNARQDEGECADAQHVAQAYMCGQIAHEVHASVQKFESDHGLERVDEFL